jgi:hypothetical protein
MIGIINTILSELQYYPSCSLICVTVLSGSRQYQAAAQFLLQGCRLQCSPYCVDAQSLLR